MDPRSGDRRQARTGALAVATAASLWGLWPLWVQAGDRAAATALGVMGLTVLPAAFLEARGARVEGRPRWGPRVVAGLLLLGVLNTLNAWLYFRALAVGPVALAAITHYLAPILVALAAPLVVGEPRSRRTPLALVLALGGTAVLFADGDFAGGAGVTTASYGAASAVLFAATILVSKRMTAVAGPGQITAVQALVGVIFLVAIGAPPLLAWQPIVGGVTSGGIAALIYFAGMRRLPIEHVGVLAYFEPLSATVIGWAFLAQTPGLSALAGGALVLTAGALVVTAPAAR